MTTVVDEAEQSRLRRWNLGAGALHLASLILIVILANGFRLPVTTFYPTGAPGTTYTGSITLFSIPTAAIIVAFLGLSSFFHFLISSGPVFPRYLDGLTHQKNVFRWVEYSLSSTLMILVIAQLNSVTTISALLAICAANVAMILFGWLQEEFATPGDGKWLPFIFGCVVGVVPWIIFAVQLIGPKAPSASSPPGFVYGIVVSLFVLFNCFAVVQFRQYRAKGKWADYLRGEKAYIVLSFVAKSLLAWQIFAGTLAK